MPIRVDEPMLTAGRIRWGLHGDGPQRNFSVSATTFKSLVGLRPRARDDERKAVDLAKKNWAVLELIARDAIALGKFEEVDRSKGWQEHYRIGDETFEKLFAKYADHFRFRQR